MVYSCVVPCCNGNLKSGPKVNVFSFPTDAVLKKKWIHAIKREESFQPSKYSKVCELHFRENEIRRQSSSFDEKTGTVVTIQLQKPRLIEGAIPSQFPNAPAYLSSSSSTRTIPDERKTKFLQDQVRENIINASQENNALLYFSLKELCMLYNSSQNDPFWKLIQIDNSVILLHLQTVPIPKMLLSVVINEDLKVSAFQGDVPLFTVSGIQLPCHVNNLQVLNTILDNVKLLKPSPKENRSINENIEWALTVLNQTDIDSYLKSNAVEFIKEQLALLMVSKPKNLRYSPEFVIFCSLLYHTSPNAYLFLRKTRYITLPHSSTIHRLSLLGNHFNPQQEISDDSCLQYASQKFKLLNENDKVVSLLVDEIHLKPYFDYKSGNVVGSSFNMPEAATSAQVFMVKSVKSHYKDVVHIIPVKTLDATTLQCTIKKIIIGLEQIGFMVVVVITDNNSINRKAMSMFVEPRSLQIVYPHPIDHKRPLFFLIDSVHILKCVRNNWLLQKNPEQCMYCPRFNAEAHPNLPPFMSASLVTVKTLHELEVNALLKYGYNLSYKALSPSNLEKQNVKLALQIFNDYLVEGLIGFSNTSSLSHSFDTAEYIRIITTWFKIMNTKSLGTGNRLNDEFKKPLRSNNDDKRKQFLEKCLTWLDEREEMKCTTGMLTKETHTALKQTTYGMLELANYCSSELNMKFILPGKFQTDDLEGRFSQYRQLAGGQHNVSVRQVFEVENKIRTKSVLKLTMKTATLGDIVLENFEPDESHVEEEQIQSKTTENYDVLNINVTQQDIDSCDNDLPVITYLAGFCVRSVLKKNKCEQCKNLLTIKKELPLNENYSLIGGIDRGKLLYPKELVTDIVKINYLVIQKLCLEKETEFMKIKNQREVVVNITKNEIDLYHMYDDEGCETHSKESILKIIIQASTNTLLNNYCKKRNDLLNHNKKKMPDTAKSSSKKRKMQTLNNN